MTTMKDYLLDHGSGGFRKRKRLQMSVVDRLPGFLRKPVGKCLWGGALGHMRRFDHDYGFERNEEGLSSMTFRGRNVLSAVPLSRSIGPVARPVALVTLGPSAKDHDWEEVRASGKMVVAVSGGATFLKEQGIRPDLMVVSDPDFSKAAGYHLANAPGVPLVIEYRAAAALHAHFPETLEDREVMLVERVNKWYGVPALPERGLEEINVRSGSPFRIPDKGDKLGRIGWSDRIEWGVFPSATVAMVALQAIVALGAKDIEIIGMDLGGGNSLYADVGTSRLARDYDEVILPSFLTMRDALAGRGIAIRNLSPRCPLPPEIFLPGK